jgi:hypothetical protein
VDRWRDGGRVVVFDAAVRVIGLAICGWAGLPLTAHNARRRVCVLEPIWVGSPDPGDWVAPGGYSTIHGGLRRLATWRSAPGGVAVPQTVWAAPALVSPRTHDDAGPPDLAALTANGQGVDWTLN